jgi:hypothetical protein
MKASPETAAKIRTAAAAGRRSKLYLWMLANFDEFSATIRDAGRPNWAELARAFAEEDLTVLSKTPPTPEQARMTWVKVRATVAAREAKKPVRPPGLTQPVAAQLMPRPPLPPPAATETAPGSYHPDERPRPRTPIRLRAPTPLAEGEAWPDDGSHLPAPLRPERKP